MKSIYFDCFAGVAGDMILGALVDAGVKLDHLSAELTKLNVAGFKLESNKVVKNGISGTKIDVITEEQKAHRYLKDIIEIIDKSDLSDDVKTRSVRVFQILAVAEAKVHNTTPEKIHFHEVGALDAIVDIVGSVVGLGLLGVDEVYASRIHVGTGFVNCEHGRIPVPAPATLEILHSVPTFSTGIKSELTTPTGAAILKTLVKSFGPMPVMTIEATGYGAGSRDLDIPNLLRVVVGNCGRQTSSSAPFETDQVTLIECNIDDMTGQHLGYVFEQLLETGALDVWFTPIQMKKNRPASLLSVLASNNDVERLIKTVLSETTTLGVRLQRMERRKLAREIITVSTSFGDIRVKVGRMGERVRNFAPEYADCRKLALSNGVPLMDIYTAAKRAAQEQSEKDS